MPKLKKLPNKKLRNVRFLSLDPTRTGSIVKPELIAFSKVLRSLKRDLYERLVRFKVDFNKDNNLDVSHVLNAENIPTAAELRLAEFDRWLQRQLELDLISNKNRARIQAYITRSYHAGIRRTLDEIGGYNSISESLRTFYRGKRKEFLDSLARDPRRMEQIGNLFSRDWNDLKGISDNIRNRIRSRLAQGILNGESPTTVYKDVADLVDSQDKAIQRLIRTAIVRAHADGQLIAYDKAGIDRLVIQVERNATEESPVCETCRKKARKVYTLKQAVGVIPIHPNCRCVWLPYVSS